MSSPSSLEEDSLSSFSSAGGGSASLEASSSSSSAAAAASLGAHTVKAASALLASGLTLLSLSTTPVGFSRWEIRFRGHLVSHHLALVPCLDYAQGVSNAPAPSHEHYPLFSAVLIHAIHDNLLDELVLLLPEGQVTADPIKLYQLLSQHFRRAAFATESAPEHLYGVLLRSRRSNFPTLAAFVSNARHAGIHFSQRVQDPAQSHIVGKLLALHIMHNLGNQTQWALPTLLELRKKLRGDPAGAFSLDDFCHNLLAQCPFDPRATPPSAGHHRKAEERTRTTFSASLNSLSLAPYEEDCEELE